MGRCALYRLFVLAEICRVCAWYWRGLKLWPGWRGSLAFLQRGGGAGEIKEENQSRKGWRVSSITLWSAGNTNLINCKLVSGFWRKILIHLQREESLMRSNLHSHAEILCKLTLPGEKIPADWEFTLRIPGFEFSKNDLQIMCQFHRWPKTKVSHQRGRKLTGIPESRTERSSDGPKSAGRARSVLQFFFCIN